MQHFCKQPPQTPLFISFLERLGDPGGVTEKGEKGGKVGRSKKEKGRKCRTIKRACRLPGKEITAEQPRTVGPYKKSKDGAEQQSPCFFSVFRSDPIRTTDTAGAKLPKTATPFLRSFWSKSESRERRRKSFLLATTHTGSRCRRRKRSETPQKPQDGQKDKQAYFTS